MVEKRLRSTLVNASAVLLASDFNISIFKPLWLTSNDILQEDDFGEGTLISPAAIQVPSRSFDLLIMPNRLQMVLKRPTQESQAELLRVIGGVAKTLPHVPYTGIGLNFGYLVPAPDGTDFFAWSTAKFSASWASLVVSPHDTAARFGSYLSYDFMAMRLKIDIKPTRQQESSDLMLAEFNYHLDLKQPGATDQVLEALQKWRAAIKHTFEVVNLLEAQ